MKKYTRASKSEKQERILHVAASLLQRPDLRLLRRNIVEQWGITERQASRYIREAQDLVVQPKTELDIVRLRDEHLELSRDLYHRLYKDGRYRQALDVLRYESDLLGLSFGLADHLRAVIASGYEVISPYGSNETLTQ